MPYIIESNLNVREVIIEKYESGDFAVIRFADEAESRLMVRRSRVYDTREEAEKHLLYKRYRGIGESGMTGYSPWDYCH